ncbi:MAG: hypothetical protein GY696_24745 [Gammaproteobacteria bacterium]|nr:hypothetical protein [Gammaproteobacteria bacterium]
MLDAEARERLTDNIAGHLIAVPEFIQKRAVANFSRLLFVQSHWWCALREHKSWH